MENFKTAKEMMEALLDGKKIRHKSWNEKGYAYLSKDGSCFYNETGATSRVSINSYNEFSIYKEPKKKKKITLYSYTYKNSKGIIAESGFSSFGWDDWSNFSTILKLLKTETK